MTLKNLLGISLDAVAADKVSVRMLIAAEHSIADAQLQGLSSENRFDAAYRAIMQMAMVALNANGYRTLKRKPGDHQTAIQTLALSVGLPQPKVIVLDAPVEPDSRAMNPRLPAVASSLGMLQNVMRE